MSQTTFSESQSPVQSAIPPFTSGYCTEVDVGRKFGNDSLFSASSTPNITQVRDAIVRKDSWLNGVLGHDFWPHQVTEEYDAVGTGRRAGQIHLRHTPVISIDRVEYRLEAGTLSNQRDAWVPGVQGIGDAIGVLVGPNANIGADYYWAYPEKAMIWWGRIKYSLAKKYRVTYSYGYPSPPDWVRDLSATMAAIECLNMFGGKFVPTDPLLEARLRHDMDLMIAMTGRRPLAAAA